MPLNLLACHTPSSRLTYRTSIRMASTIVGKSGRVYVHCDMLQRHREDLKLSFYDLSLRLVAKSAGSRRLRMHIDQNQGESILIYPYFKGTLLALIQDDPESPPAEQKKILQNVKSDNILEAWNCDKEGHQTVTDIALGNFDIAFKSQGGEPCQIPYVIGNAMWRSPEGQPGRGVTKASDMFSFGLVWIYAFGGGDLLLLNNYQELVRNDIMPEQEILTRHFSYFGSVPKGLLEQVNSDNWCNALKAASRTAEEAVREQPGLRFERWGEELGPEAQNMISGMTNPG
ncbi:kinase-like protein [Clathrospora elynae]|uniref:Kinase-like protein n=1 Tax=Clathrospora elynae TaxID=706981 RepID=A0A6A5SZ49_9PLEO|nr:kinase-like protein [Clathrospora elynae]